MVRIAGINIPEEKRIEIALTYIYGIGKRKSQLILEKAKVDASTRAKDLNGEVLNAIRELVDKEKIEGELRREISRNIKRLQNIGSYRGSRHMKNLPTRGQRTKTNSRTRRGNKRTTVTSGKRKLEKT